MKKFENGKVLKIEDYEYILGSLKELGTEKICISGGEPLLYKNLTELIKLSSKLGMATSLNTNGWLLDKNIASNLFKNGLVEINLSIDFPNIYHDKFRGIKGLLEKIKSTIPEINKLDIDYILNIRMVLMKNNFKDIFGMMDLVKELRADIFSIDLLENNFNDKDLLLNAEDIVIFNKKIKPKIIERLKKVNFENDELKEIAIKQINSMYDIKFNSYKNFQNGLYWANNNIQRKCKIPYNFLIIEGDGSVLPCNSVEYTRNPIVGNLFRNNIKDIWESIEFNNFRENRFEFCRKCPMNMSTVIKFNNKIIKRDVD